LERAFRQKDPGLGWMKADVLFDKQRSDPRWSVIVHKVGLADDQLH